MTESECRGLIDVARQELTALNEHCQTEVGIGSFEHWQYEADEGTIAFAGGTTPGVRALAQVVGTTSTRSKSWLWSWANESIPSHQASSAATVRAFDERENVPILLAAEPVDDEYLGWEMTAVTVKLTGAVGGYRVPRESGSFTYFVFFKLEGLGERNDRNGGQKGP